MHLKGASRMEASGLGRLNTLVGAELAISQVLIVNGPRKQCCLLVQPQIPVFKADFSARASYHCPSILIAYSLMSGCSYSFTNLQRMAV